MVRASVFMSRSVVVIGRILLVLFSFAAPLDSILADEDDQESHVESFFEAVRRGDLKAVKAALDSGIDVDATYGPGWTALYVAAERSRPNVLKTLIDSGANVNAKNYLGVTPLHWAASRGPRESVKALIEAGADVNADCSQHDTPLGNAASVGNIDTANELIKSSADVNGGGYMTPLALAARSGHASMIKLLVANGAKVNDANNPPLHWANKRDAAKALLDAGAQANIRNLRGQTTLHLTTGVWYPKADAVKLLIEAKANVNARSKTGSTPLHEAIRKGELDIVELLIAAGADLNSRDHNGNTPLSLAKQVHRSFSAVLTAAGAKHDGRSDLYRAVEAGRLKRVKELIQDGADVNETNYWRMTAAHAASQLGHARILAELIRAGGKVDRRNESGLRPLHYAADGAVAEMLISEGAKVAESAGNAPTVTPMYIAVISGRADVVRVFIKHQADFKHSDGAGALLWATFAGQPEVVKVLLDNHAGPQDWEQLSGESALHVAACGALADMPCPKQVTSAVRLTIAKLLIEKGADVNAGADNGYLGTPLMCAAMSGHIEMVKLLLDNGANVDAASAKGRLSGYTALHRAAEAGHTNVVKLLLEKHAEINALTDRKSHPGVKSPLDLAKDKKVKELLIQRGGKPAPAKR